MQTKEKPEHTCSDCDYYIQHYYWFQDSYQALGMGHCTHPPRTRTCKPKMAACAKWKALTPRQAFDHIPGKGPAR